MQTAAIHHDNPLREVTVQQNKTQTTMHLHVAERKPMHLLLGLRCRG
jgi:hypothetical protein